MRIGDKVYIWDTQSDLFIKEGEVVEIKTPKALVMIEIGAEDLIGCIVDWFDIDKLYRKSRKRCI